MKKPKTIGIIGGKGKMGELFAGLFKNAGYKILISDKNTILTNQKLALLSDVIIISVPIDKTIQVIEEIAPYLKESKLLMDLTSIKAEPVKAMLKSKAAVIGLHPMFNDTSFGKYQPIIICPARPRGWLSWLEDFLAKIELVTFKLDAQEHDKLTASIQGLVHFAEITFAKTLRDSNLKIKDLLKLASPASALKIEMVARILAQDANLYGNIAIQNQFNIKLFKKYLAANQQLFEIIKSGDLKRYTEFFNKSAQFLGSYKDQALHESDWIIAQLTEKNKHKILGTKKIKLPPNKPNLSQTSKKELQSTLASLGPPASYSDLISQKFIALTAKRNSKKFTKKLYHSITDVFEALKNNQAAYGLVPLYNSINGTVTETYDQLWQNNIQIVHTLNLNIKHALGILPWANPKEISCIMSHPQALAQSQKFIKKHYSGVTLIPNSSTTAALQDVKERKSQHIAVIAPEKALQAFGFKKIKSQIADNKDNSTTFALIVKNRSNSARNISKIIKKIRKSASRSSIAFNFPKDKPGSLAKIFNLFASAGINMTKIESRPSLQSDGGYIFYLEFDRDQNEKNLNHILSLIKREVKQLKILGTYSKIPL